MPSGAASNHDSGRWGFAPGRIVHLHPTARCNLACAHCYSSSSPTKPDGLPVELLIAAIRTLKNEGYEYLSLSGGEALLYSGLPLLTETAAELGYRLSLITNGGPVSASRLPILKQMDIVAVSFDGMEARHNAVRGNPNAFRMALRGLDMLGAADIKTAIACCVTSDSLEDIPEIADVAFQHGASTLQLRPIVMTGRATATMSGVSLNASGLNRLFLLTQALRLEYGSRLAIHLDLVHASQISNAGTCYKLDDAEGDMTNGLQLSDIVNPVVITPDGNLRPFTFGFNPRFDIASIGNPLEPGIAAFMQGSRHEVQAVTRQALSRAQNSGGFLDWFQICETISYELEYGSLRRAAG